MSTETAKEGIHFDPGFIRTLPGIIKVAQAANSLIGFICVQTIYMSAYSSAGGWYAFVSMTGFWIPLLLFLAYLFHFVERLNWLPWNVAEFGFATVWAAFFFIAACVAAANGRADPGWGAAAFFGFVAIPLFGYEAYCKYNKWKAGDSAQGERTTTTTTDTTNAAAPSYPTY